MTSWSRSYHDQGHIPLKVVGFQYDYENNKWKTVSGVNITLGLPIIQKPLSITARPSARPARGLCK
jgi:hypothetical protein